MVSRKRDLLPPRAKAERDQDKSLERRTKTFFDLVLILMLCATGMGVIRRFAFPLYSRWRGKPVPLAHFDHDNPVPGDLSFTNMGLKSLSQDLFSGMPGVKALRLNNNFIGALPKNVFHGLPNLQALHLDSNRIGSVVPKTFSGLPKLRHLDLSGNLLTKIPGSIFNGMSDLQYLSLGGNKLKALPGKIFRDQTQLQHLSLNFNEIEGLPPNVFANLANLEKLFIFENKLASLPAGVFNNLTKLQVLNLNQNPLKSLPPDVYGGLVKILADRNELDAEPEPAAAGTCRPPMMFNYQGPCWNDSGVVTYEEGKGYTMMWAGSPSGAIQGIEGPGAVAQIAGSDSSQLSVITTQARRYNVTVLAHAGLFCGIQGIHPRGNYGLLRGLFGPEQPLHPLNWWSLEGFFSLSLVISLAPRGWIRYLFILLFVCVSFHTHGWRQGRAKEGPFLLRSSWLLK